MRARQFAYLDAADEDMSAPVNARLVAVVVGDGAASAVVTAYNNTSAVAADTIGTVDAAADRDVPFYGIRCPKGLYVKLTAGNAKVTVVWE